MGEEGKYTIDEKILLNYIFKYDDEKIIKKLIKLLKKKYNLKSLQDTDLDYIAKHKELILDNPDKKNYSNNNTTIKSINTIIDFLAKYKFSTEKLIKLYNIAGIYIDEDTAEAMLEHYFPKGKLDKTKLVDVLEEPDVRHSNKSEILRAFNIYLKKLEKMDSSDLFKKMGLEDTDEKQKKI